MAEVAIHVEDMDVGGHLVKTFNGRDLHADLKSRKDYTNWAKAQIKRARLVENRDYVKLAQKGELSTTGQTRHEYHFTIEAGKHIGMMSGTERGFDVREYFIACERVALQATIAPAIPDFTNPAEAARAWALQYEARVHAEATKAEIGHRREATAMNTASQATKKANRLEVELDRSKEYATIKRMEMLYHGTSFSWRLLKSASADIGIPPIDVFDANYGTVKAYHADAWAEAYALAIDSVEAA